MDRDAAVWADATPVEHLEAVLEKLKDRNVQYVDWRDISVEILLGRALERLRRDYEDSCRFKLVSRELTSRPIKLPLERPGLMRSYQLEDLVNLDRLLAGHAPLEYAGPPAGWRRHPSHCSRVDR